MSDLLNTNLAEVGTDCISRKQACDAFNTNIDELVVSGKGNAYAVERYLNRVLDRIKQLPPIQPEPHWIPVTEDTPTEDDDYWATFDAETGRFVDWASWHQGRWVTWIEGSPAPLSNVIAWCKPMEPYKGVTT